MEFLFVRLSFSGSKWITLQLTAHETYKIYMDRYVCLAHVSIVQYIPRNIHTVTALLCFVVVIHWLIFPYPSGLLHWHCGNLTIAPVPAKQPWWIWINTSCELIMNDCITTTKQSTTKPCAYFVGYTVLKATARTHLDVSDAVWTHSCCILSILILFSLTPNLLTNPGVVAIRRL